MFEKILISVHPEIPIFPPPPLDPLPPGEGKRVVGQPVNSSQKRSIGTRAGINPPLVNKARTLHIFSDTGKTKMMFCHG
jgi:hypothetical protein